MRYGTDYGTDQEARAAWDAESAQTLATLTERLTAEGCNVSRLYRDGLSITRNGASASVQLRAIFREGWRSKPGIARRELRIGSSGKARLYGKAGTWDYDAATQIILAELEARVAAHAAWEQRQAAEAAMLAALGVTERHSGQEPNGCVIDYSGGATFRSATPAQVAVLAALPPEAWEHLSVEITVTDPALAATLAAVKGTR